jgi:hypothetical protein
MKFHFLNLLILGSLFLFSFIHATEDDGKHGAVVLDKRTSVLTADEGSLVKRCEGHHDGLLDLDCLTGSLVDLLESILGGGHGHHHHYNDHNTDLVRQLVKLIRKLLHTLGLNHHGGLDLDDLLGGLLGHGHDHDNDDDFGCGCGGDENALVDHLIKTIEGLLHELVDCKDGLIPRLVEVVTDLLGGCKEEHHRRRRHIEKRRLKKRCEHHGDGLLGLDCLLDSVVDLLQSLLGGHDHHHYDHSSIDLVTQLVKLLRKLLHSLGLSHHGNLDLDGLLGGLLGHGHDHDNDNDFGCGCNGDDNALVDHLVELIQDLLKQLGGCKDGKSGLIPRLIEVVTDLLEDLLRDRHHGGGGGKGKHGGGKGHHGNDEHHGGSGDHHGNCGDSLGLDCLLDTVVGLVDSLLGGGNHHHGHVDVKVGDLLDELVRVVRRLLGALDIDGGLKLDVLLGGGDHHNDDDDFGCGCHGDNDSLITHLIETIDRLLGQLGGCDDDSGLIAQLIKAVRQLLSSVHHKRGEHELRKRFSLRRRSTFGKRHQDDSLDVGLLCGVLDTIQDLLNQILGECNKGGGDDALDADLLEKVRDLIRKILKGVKEVLDCLTKGKLGGLNHSVSSLVKQVCALLECLNGRDHRHGGGLDDLLDALVDAITSLVNGCRLARLVDLDGLVVLHH